MFQTRAATIGKARSPTVDRFDVGTANVSDDHDRSRCLDGRSLMLRRSTDRYAGDRNGPKALERALPVTGWHSEMVSTIASKQ